MSKLIEKTNWFTVQIRTFGIALVVIGVSIGMFLNYFTNSSIASSIIMLISIVCINYGNKFKFKLNKDFKLPFLYQILMIIYFVCSYTATESNGFQFLVYHIYIIALTFSLSNIKDYSFWRNTIKQVFYLSIPFSILGIYLCHKGLIANSDTWQLRQDNINYVLEPFTTASLALWAFFAGLCMNKNKKDKIFFYIMSLLNLYLIFLCEKRTPMVIAFIGLIIYYIKLENKPRKFKATIIISIIISILISSTFLSWNSFSDFIDNIYNGILNILGDQSVTDNTGSAIMRYVNRTQTYQYIENEFELPNYLLGGGYMVLQRQIDNPLLQSYLDMGVLGILGYVTIVLYYPLRCLLKKTDNITLFYILCSIYNVFTFMSSGYPQYYQKYTPICLIIFSFIAYKHTSKNE